MVLVVPVVLLVHVLLVPLLQHHLLLPEVLQLQRQGHYPHEQLVVDALLLEVWLQYPDVVVQLALLHRDPHVVQDHLHVQLRYHLPFLHG